MSIILDLPNIKKCFSALSVRMRMSTYNSKHGRFPCKQKLKYLPKRESTPTNVQMCPSKEIKELNNRHTRILYLFKQPL